MIKNKVILLVIIGIFLIIGVVATNFLTFSEIEKTTIDQLKNTQRIETQHAAIQLESHIFQVKDELSALSKFSFPNTIDTACKSDLDTYHEMVGGKLESVLRVDANGNVVSCSSSQFSSYLGLNVKNKEYFRSPKKSGDVYISGALHEGSTVQVIIAAPVFETTAYSSSQNFTGEFKGILISIIDMNDLSARYLTPILLSGKGSFLVINKNTGETLLKSSDLPEYDALKGLVPQKESDIINFGTYGKTIITASDLTLGPETWRIIILTPYKNVGKDLDIMRRRHIITISFSLLVILGGFLLLIYFYTSMEKIQHKLNRTNITLEKLGISIESEHDAYGLADIILDPHQLYLIKEDDENNSHELFISALNKGYAGLGIVRDDPRNLQDKYNIHRTSFIWLTKNKAEDIPCETDIRILRGLVTEFVKKSEKSVVLLDRFDYILHENKLEDVIACIHGMKDLVQSHDSVILISATPELIPLRVIKMLEAETIDIYGKQKKTSIAELDRNILTYINENNVTSRLVSYKDITKKFGITKPTTRAKLRGLQLHGLVQIEQKGRFKSLKITSAGRRIIG